MAFDGLHPGQSLPVHSEVWDVLMDGSILCKTSRSKLVKGTILVGPGYDKSPSIARFTLHVTVHRKTVVAAVVDFVHTAFGGAFLEIV